VIDAIGIAVREAIDAIMREAICIATMIDAIGRGALPSS